MNRAFSFRWIAAAALLALPFAAPSSASAACGVIASDIDKNTLPDLLVVGNGYPQNLIVNVYQNQTVVFLDCNGNGTFTDANWGDLNGKVFAGSYTSIQAWMKGAAGTDNITFNVADAWSGQVRWFGAHTGGGTTKFTVASLPGGALTNNSKLVVEIGGSAGNDKMTLDVPDMSDSEIYFRSNLMSANNSATVINSHTITNSVVEFASTLQGYRNGCNFTNTGVIDGTLDVSFDGGRNLYGSDVCTASIGGTIGSNGRLFLKTNLGASNDLFTGSLDLGTLNVAAGGELHIDVRGQLGSDKITLNHGVSVGPATNAGLIDIDLDGGDGLDALTLDLSGGGLKNDGMLRVRVDGGINDDVLTCLIDVAATSAASSNMDLYVTGGAGNDKPTFTLNNNGPNLPANFSYAGSAIIDGGPGTDTCVATGSGISHKRNCEL